MKRIWWWVISGLALAAIAGGGLFFLLSAKGSSDQDAKVKMTQTSQQEKDRNALKQVSVSGIAAKAGQIRLTKMTPGPEGWLVAIEASGKAKGLDDVTKAAKELFRQLSTVGPPLADVEVVFKTDAFRDDFGRQLSGLTVAKFKFSKQIIEKVNWVDVSPEKLPLLADAFWQHPILTSQQAEKSKQP